MARCRQTMFWSNPANEQARGAWTETWACRHPQHRLHLWSGSWSVQLQEFSRSRLAKFAEASRQVRKVTSPGAVTWHYDFGVPNGGENALPAQTNQNIFTSVPKPVTWYTRQSSVCQLQRGRWPCHRSPHVGSLRPEEQMVSCWCRLQQGLRFELSQVPKDWNAFKICYAERLLLKLAGRYLHVKQKPFT